MKIRTKIMLGFLILAIMLAVSGAFSIYELRTVGASVQALLDDNYRSISASKIRKSYKEYSRLWDQPIVDTPREGNLGWYFKDAHQAFKDVKVAVQDLMAINDQAMYNTAGQREMYEYN